MKKCYECGEVKSDTEYSKRSVCRDGLNPRCKLCATARHREWCAQNKDRVKSYNRTRSPRPEYDNMRWHTIKKYQRHGLTREIYEGMKRNQEGKCAICRVTPDTFQVDHDHSCCPSPFSCGQCVRGLLCGFCNRALGLLRDSPSTLRAAADYLDSYRTQVPEPILIPGTEDHPL